MDQWTVEYVDSMTREVLEQSFVTRRAIPFPPSEEPMFDWDKVTGMVVRAWIYAREHPSWMQEVPVGETNEHFADLLAFAVSKTTSTGVTDTNAWPTAGGFARFHVGRQRYERDLVREFVRWALQGVGA